MKFFKNKFFIILLAIAIFATVFTATLSVMGVTDPIKDVANTVATPFKAIGNVIKESFEGFSKYFSTVDKLDEKNKELENRLEELEIQLADKEAVLEENERLRTYLEIKKTYPDFKMTEGLIISRESDNNATFLTLDKGSNDGIKIGMPIIVKNGLVGSVCEVGKTWCRVRVVSESSSSVGAYVSRSGEIGILRGDISLKDSGCCRLEYIGAEADVTVDDLIYTSGIGGVYPKGLYVGKVSSVDTVENLRTKIATVSLAVNVNNLRYVLIVTDFDVYDGE